MLTYSNLINKCVKNVYMYSARSISFRSAAKLLSIYFFETTDTPKPPYNYVCQVGDPVLRAKATPIDTKMIGTPEFQKTLEYLCTMMRKYGTVGLAAPQIGLPWQVFVMEMTEKSVEDIHYHIRKLFDIVPHPLTYFINPKMKIINPAEIIAHETCASIDCYEAEVPRATEIEISALNCFGEPFSWRAKGWLARIAQHEMDHLKGILYVDRMFPLTFDYSKWEKKNKDNGKIAAD